MTEANIFTEAYWTGCDKPLTVDDESDFLVFMRTILQLDFFVSFRFLDFVEKSFHITGVVVNDYHCICYSIVCETNTGTSGCCDRWGNACKDVDFIEGQITRKKSDKDLNLVIFL